MIEIRKYIKFFFDFFLKRYGEEVIIIPTIFEKNGLEIDLIVGEDSAKILGIRYLETHSDNYEDEEDDKSDEDEIILAENDDEQVENEEIDHIEEDQEEEELEDVVWDFSKISAQSLNGTIILSFIFDYDEYCKQSEDPDDFSDQDISTEEIKGTEEGEEEVILRDKVIKIEILASNGKPMGACIKKYDKKTQSELETIACYSLDSELFRRQIIF